MTILRQRLRLRRSSISWLARPLMFLVGCALAWYGAMLVALALKAPPTTINSISAYRTVFDFLAGLDTGDQTGRVRLIAAAAGLSVFAICAFLAWTMIPIPYRARKELPLLRDRGFSYSVRPRAVERVAEIAAGRHGAITAATGRFNDGEIHVDVHARQAVDIVATLIDVRREVADALGRHGLPPLPVAIVLTTYSKRTRRELA